MNKREKMYDLISSYESSNLSQAKFCEQAGIKVANLIYWRKNG